MITKEEIKLCKQIAEKHRKEIVQGDWIYLRKKRIICGIPFIEACLVDGNYLIPKKDTMLMEKYLINEFGFSDEGYRQVSKLTWFPLWTVKDCLEFLDEKTTDWSLDKDIDEEGKQTGKFCFWWMASPRHKDNYTLGKTPLEACLKAVLAVLEKGK